jgi:RND family efflux transporter MFP subunit
MSDTVISTRRAASRRSLVLLLAAAVVAAVTVGTYLLTRHRSTAGTPVPSGAQVPAPGAAPALTVTTTVPRRESWHTTLEASGAVAPWQEASIGTQVGGYQLTEVLVDVGDRVRKGQVLARFDQALLRADEAQLQASFEQAESNRKRAAALTGSGSISAQDAQQAATVAKTAAALLASKQLQLRYTEVLAPDDGTISMRTATLGAVVPAAQELFRLIRRNRLEWRGELTAAQLAQVHPGQTVTLSLPDGGSASATVRQIAPTLDAGSRLGLVYADIEPGSPARAGMYVSGRIILAESPALVVPAECVVIRDGRSYVAMATAASAVTRVTLQAVTVGRRQGGDVEILDGLPVQARVIVQGAGFLNDGDTVRRADGDLPP